MPSATIATFLALSTMFLFAVILDAQAQSPESALLSAIANKDIQTTKRLLRNGVNPEVRNDRGHPALVVAAIQGTPEIAAALIESGAKVDIQTVDDGFTPLIAAAIAGNTDVARKLIEKKATVDARDKKGGTALMAAAFHGHEEVLSLLLEKGADINAKDNQGMTALMDSAAKCRVATTKVLWNAGASITATDNSGNTARVYATVGKCPLIIRVAASNLCKDVSSIYTTAELKRWESVFQPKLVNFKEQVERQLQPEARDRLRPAKLVTESPSNCKQPFLFYASAGDPKQIAMPMLSIKFLYDLLFANHWLSQNGYVVKTFKYVNMLKYRRSVDFQGGKYPTPLLGLGVPHTPLGDPLFDKTVTADDFAVIFDGVLFFLLAHEAAHVALNHLRSAPENETVADALAMEMVIRTNKFPGAINEMFLLTSYWQPSGADFFDPVQYTLWQAAESTHPVTASRIKALASTLHANALRYYPGRAESDPDIKRIEELAVVFSGLADAIHFNTTFSDLFEAALQTNPSTLALENTK